MQLKHQTIPTFLLVKKWSFSLQQHNNLFISITHNIQKQKEFPVICLGNLLHGFAHQIPYLICKEFVPIITFVIRYFKGFLKREKCLRTCFFQFTCKYIVDLLVSLWLLLWETVTKIKCQRRFLLRKKEQCKTLLQQVVWLYSILLHM